MDFIRQLLQSWVVPAKETLHQFLIDTLRRCTSLGSKGVMRGQVMFSELDDKFEYPQSALNSLRDLIQEYDGINDSLLLNDLQKSIAVTQDDASVGIKLARLVNDTIRRIREKDALASRIVVLATMLELYHKDLAARHADWASPTIDPATDLVLNSAIKSLQSDAASFWAEISTENLKLLSNYLQVDPESVPSVLQDYLGAATNTLFVEPIIQ